MVKKGIVGSYADVAGRKLPEAALLLESEDNFRNLVELLQEGIWVIDEDSRTAYVNTFMARMLGYTVEEMQGKEIFSFMGERSREIASQGVKRRSVGISETHEFELLRKNGSRIYADLSTTSIADKDGKYVGALASVQDITERKLAQEEIKESEARFRRISALTSDISYSCKTGEDGRFSIDWMTGAAERITGYSIEEIKALGCWRFLVVEEDQPLFSENVIGLAPAHYGFCELRIKHKNGGIVWVASSAECVQEEPRTPGLLLLYGGLRDITERKQLEQKLQEMATHDFLTGLSNRMLFYDRFDIACANADRSRNKVAILSLDLDRFKAVNDTLGHKAGDKLLIAAAGRLSKALRKSDTVARFGGDEFVILLTGVDDPDAVTKAAEKLIEDFRRPFRINKHNLTVTLSIGIALYPDDGEDVEELLKISDKMMYAAKENGRDRLSPPGRPNSNRKG